VDLPTFTNSYITLNLQNTLLGLIKYNHIAVFSHVEKAVKRQILPKNAMIFCFCVFLFFFIESLRMYPPLLVFMKVCTMPFQLPTQSGGTYKVEVGTPVTIPVYAIHHDPQYFPDPEHYDPERFSEENKNNRHRHSYLPFSDGPRICLGMNTIIILRSHALFSEQSTEQWTLRP